MEGQKETRFRGVEEIMGEVRLIGADWCPDCRRAKAFLSQHRVPYDYVNLETTPEATSEVEVRNGGKRIIPTIIFPDGTHLAEPSNDVLADKLGIIRAADNDFYDLVIAGGGPTALTTAIYAARENLKTLVIEKSALGGQAGVTEKFDNYPGFPDGVSGSELAQRFVLQAQRYGVELLQAVAVQDFQSEGKLVQITASSGQEINASALLLATGSKYRRTKADGEASLVGAGVHFCATCDGPFYKGADNLVVIGGGNSGLEEGLFLTQFAKHVTIIQNSDQLGASRLLQDKVSRHLQMSVKLNTSVERFNATSSGKLESLTVRDLLTGITSEESTNGAFVFIGMDPNTQWLPESIELDERGFISTDLTFKTSVPRVFAAGDVRAGSTKQLASAVGEGAAVAIQIRQYLDSED